MRDHVRSQRRNWWVAAVVALALAVWGAGCSASPPAASGAVEADADAVAMPEEAVTVEAATAELTAVELTTAGADNAAVALSVDGPLSWTSFDSSDAIVVELRGAVPRAGVEPLVAATGPVRGVAVELDQAGTSAVTRVTIATRGEVESRIDDAGEALTVRLHASEPRMAQAPAEMTNEDLTPPPPPPTPAPAPVAMGTPEDPVAGPEPVGVVATRLQNVDVESGDEGTTVTLRGDGQFRYSSFGLEDPHRFVLDLGGVASATGRSSIAAAGDPLARVRVAQYRSDPDPVARVVFDLAAATAPTIDAAPDGLRLFFARPMTAAEATAQMAKQAAPVVATRDPAPAPEPRDVPASRPQHAAATAPASDPRPVLASSGAPVPRPMPARQPPTPAESASASPPSAAPPAQPATPQDEAVTAFTPEAVDSGERRYHGEPITLTLVDADLKETLRSFAQISGLNTVVYPGTTGSVTVELTNVPWDQALEQILKMNNLSYQIEGNIMRIAPREQFQREAQDEQQLKQAEALSLPLRTVVKRISYATANDVASVLRGTGGGSVISERGSVIVDGRTNTVIIRELPRYMDTVLAIIEHLDTPEPQVHIEARIVETSKQFSRSLGIAWGVEGIADAAHGNTTGLQFPNNIQGDGGVNLLTGGRNALINLSMGNVLNTFRLDAQLQAAESEGLANILSSPSVTVLNNEQAEIQSGLSIPIQTVANNTVSVQFVNATLRLQVTPHVTADGTVLMDINIQKREPRTDLIVPGATNAPIATKEARTRVIVRDGGTTVIGGIYEVSTSEGEDRVPGLANIPILGHLFRNKSRDEQNEELLIFITPRVLQL